MTPLRRPARRRGRVPSTPLPLLYGIRLLILGVGVAAIAGTLLSVLSPQDVPTPTQSQDAGSAPAAVQRPTAPDATIAAVPLTEELGRLKAELEEMVTLTPGLEQSLFLLDLDTGAYVSIAADQPMASASTIKLPVLVAFLQAVDAGDLDLNQAMVLQDRHIASGSGEFQVDPPGSRYTALAVATAMMIDSDNTATNMMVELLGGAEVLNQRFQGWGLNHTVLRSPLPDLEGTNTTSAQDLSLLWALLDRGGLLSLRSHHRMTAMLQRTYNRSLIPAGTAETAVVANKTGDIASVLADTALIDAPSGSRYVLTILVQRPENDGRASELLRRLSEHVDRELNQAVVPTGQSAAPADTDGEAAPYPTVAPDRVDSLEGVEPVPVESDVDRSQPPRPVPSERVPQG